MLQGGRWGIFVHGAGGAADVEHLAWGEVGVGVEEAGVPAGAASETNSFKLILGQAPHITFAPTHFIAAKRSMVELTPPLRHPRVPTPPPRIA